MSGEAACERLFESITQKSMGAVALDHASCDTISPGARVNVLPHLDESVPDILSTVNGSVSPTDASLRHFPKLGNRHNVSNLRLVLRP